MNKEIDRILKVVKEDMEVILNDMKCCGNCYFYYLDNVVYRCDNGNSKNNISKINGYGYCEAWGFDFSSAKDRKEIAITGGEI